MDILLSMRMPQCIIFLLFYGLFGLIGMDWFALFVVFLTDILIGKIIVESMMRKIQKIPISLGVLQ